MKFKKASLRALTGKEVRDRIDELCEWVKSYEITHQALILANIDKGSEDSPSIIWPAENLATSLREVVAHAELIREIMQPHYFGFEVGDARKNIDAFKESQKSRAQ